MNDSNGFQTGGIVLLAMSIVFCGLAFSLVLPMINGANQPGLIQLSTNAAAATEAAASPRATEAYAEFFPGSPLPSVTSTTESRRPIPPTKEFGRTETASYNSSPSPSAFPSQPVPQFQQQLASVPDHPSQQPPTPALPANPFYASSTSAAGLPEQQATTSVGESVPAAVAINSSVPASQQPTSHVLTPDQLPSGSVYAPVTVNLDSSMFTEQTRLLEARLREYQAESEAKTQALAHQADETRRRQRKDRDRNSQENRDQELQKISRSFEELVASFRELQNQTNQSLQQVSAQAESSKMAADLIESYKRALALEEERRKEILEASRMAVALEIQKFANQQQQLLQRSAVQSVPNPTVRTVEVPLPFALPQPLELPREPTSSIVTPDLNVRMQASSISRPRVISSLQDEEPMHPRRRPVKDFIREQTFSPSRLTDDRDLKASETRFSNPVRVFSQPEEDKPLEVTTPQWDLMDIPKDDVEPDVMQLRVPTELESTSLSPVRDPAPRNVVSPVAYANTYRFTMEVDSDGDQKVVSVNDRRNVQNASSGNRNLAHTASAVKQTSAEALPVRPAASANAPALANLPVKNGPSRDMRRDTRNAGRGMNHNFRTSEHEKNVESRKPRLKLSVPAFTTKEGEPSLIHRMSSAVRQMGRSIR